MRLLAIIIYNHEYSDYLIYTNLDDALARAETEGARRGYSYYKVGRGTRYKTSPKETSDGNYALDVTVITN